MSRGASCWKSPQMSRGASCWKAPQMSRGASCWKDPQMSHGASCWKDPQMSHGASCWKDPQMSPGMSHGASWWESESSQMWHRWKEYQKIDGVCVREGVHALAQFLFLAQVEGGNNGRVLEHIGVDIHHLDHQLLRGLEGYHQRFLLMNREDYRTGNTAQNLPDSNPE